MLTLCGRAPSLLCGSHCSFCGLPLGVAAPWARRRSGGAADRLLLLSVAAAACARRRPCRAVLPQLSLGAGPSVANAGSAESYCNNKYTSQHRNMIVRTIDIH